ncbi:MAG: hypothetical protein H5T97_01170 [Firmicutes bacterium]|nr:hypothetical protein [Bacillota bacterium]
MRGPGLTPGRCGAPRERCHADGRGLLLGFLLGALLCFTEKEKHPPCNCQKPFFESVMERNFIAGEEDRFSRAIDVSRFRTFSFLVYNEGPCAVVVQPELSPDAVNWSSFGELSYVLEAGEKRLLVPQYFLRYARVRFRSKVPGRPSAITVWFQGQS